MVLPHFSRILKLRLEVMGGTLEAEDFALALELKALTLGVIK